MMSTVNPDGSPVVIPHPSTPHPGRYGCSFTPQLTVRTTADLAHLLQGDEYVLPAGLVMLLGTVDLGDKALRISTDTFLRGLADSAVVSTVTGGVVRATNINSHLVMREFSIVALGGPCVNLVGTIAYQCNLFFVGLIGADAGTITGFNVQAVKDCYIEAANGLRFAGVTNKVFVDRSPFYGVTGSAIILDDSLVAAVADITTCFFKFDSPGVGITAEAGYSVGEGKLRGSLIEGTATPLAGLGPADVNWTMSDNSGVRNSRVAGFLHLTAEAATNLTAINTPVKVAGTTVGGSMNERFAATNNRLTYIGRELALANIDAIVTVSTTNNTALNFYIAKNGVAIAESASRVRVGSGSDERQCKITMLAWMNPDDYFEVWVEGVTGTAALTCSSLTLSVTV